MMTMAAESLEYTKAESWRMFNRISKRYDFLNRLLSFGMDVGWRKKLADFLPQRNDLTLLDLATGTGDVPIYLVLRSKRIKSVVGVDMAEKMLVIGREKIMQNLMRSKITLQTGDVNRLSFNGASFDCTTIAFGIRNIENPAQALSEMYRVLKAGGRSLILEFSLPQNPFLRVLSLVYMRHILPFLGWVISGDFMAYKYLNQTIEKFPYGNAFCRLMTDAGFKNVKANTLGLGVATIYQGDKE